MTPPIRTPWTQPARAALAAGLACLALAGCAPRSDGALADFLQWQQEARTQAQAGMLRWTALYQQSFDRLTDLPSSMAQDAYLENTVLLLSMARKYEARELDAQQFAQAREQIEQQIAARLR